MAETKKNQTTAESDGQRSVQIVVFKLGQEEYGLQIDQIKEVVLTPSITRIPQTAPFVKGVANIRGNVIAIFDLENRFNPGSNSTKSNGNKYTLVVESEDIKLGLLVDEVPNTISVKASDLDQSVSIINDANTEGNYINGIIRSGERLIILIDIFKVIDVEMTGSLRKMAAEAA